MSQNGTRKKWLAGEKLRIVLLGMQPNVEISDLPETVRRGNAWLLAMACSRCASRPVKNAPRARAVARGDYLGA